MNSVAELHEGHRPHLLVYQYVDNWVVYRVTLFFRVDGITLMTGDTTPGDPNVENKAVLCSPSSK